MCRILKDEGYILHQINFLSTVNDNLDLKTLLRLFQYF